MVETPKASGAGTQLAEQLLVNAQWVRQIRPSVEFPQVISGLKNREGSNSHGSTQPKSDLQHINRQRSDLRLIVVGGGTYSNQIEQVATEMASRSAIFEHDHRSSNGAALRAARPARSDEFQAYIRSDPPGTVDLPGHRDTFVSIHIGPSVQVFCRRGGRSHSGTAVHGDIDTIPAGTPSVWSMDTKDTVLLLRLPTALLHNVARQLDLDPARVEIMNRFMMRDRQIENIGWAVKAEMESGFPSGRLYMDSLAVSLASRLIRCHSSLATEPAIQHGGLPAWRLREVLSYIEENLSEDISLQDVASVAGLSVPHFNRIFRESEGLPVHQYLIQRRIEHAKTLLIEGELPISQIALDSGFAHQSHLAYHMRRVIGVSPRAFREAALLRKRKAGPTG